MATRRGFLQLLSAGALAPSLSWAEMGGPAYLAAARRPAGDFALFGLDAAGTDVFSVPLPERAHAAAVHPRLARAVVFARRPGTYVIALDCGTGKVFGEIAAPDGTYFCGHGAFDASGARLLTTETEIDTGAGRIGVWDANAGFRRIGAMPSGGIGPHDCVLLPGGQLAVANGSLETGPDGQADPISVAEMRPNLTYLDLDSGEIIEVMELVGDMRRNSIRHLAARTDGMLAFSMQWHGPDTEAPALLGLHRTGQKTARLLSAADPAQRSLRGYAGSVAFSGDGARVAISSPRGGLVDVFDVATGAHAWRGERPDVCGLARHGSGFAATTGLGEWLILDGAGQSPRNVVGEPGRAWDNHMLAISA